MKFITFARDGEQLPGIWLGEGHIADLSSAFGSILELIEAGEAAAAAGHRPVRIQPARCAAPDHPR